MLMTRTLRSCVWITLAACATSAIDAAPQSQKNDARKSGVTAILVDVVVRDKAGNPVSDLREDEFELVEDGQKQQIGSFTPIFKGPAAGTGGTNAAAPVAP